MGKNIAMCGVSLIGMAWAASAAAQSAPEVQETVGSGLNEIVVTAQRRSENLQSVPVTVTALTADSLASGAISDTTDLQVAVPGLVAFQTANNFTPFIRGVGTNQTASGSEASVAIYIDGVYQGGKPGNVMELGAIERIEVLKGPQGTLYGRNATGGAINIVTRTPSHDPEIELELGYGRFDEKRVKAYASGAITDTLLASVSLTGRWSDGYIRDVFRNKDQAALEQSVAMAKLRWIPNDRLTAELSASYAYVDDPTFNSAHVTPGTISTAAALGFLAPTGNDEAATSAQDPFSQVKTTRVSLNTTYDLDAIRLVSITGYIDMDAFSFFDIDSSPANIQHLNVGQVGEQFSQELQVQSNNDGPFSWIVGAYYLKFDEGYGDRPKPYHLMVGLPYPYRPADLLQPGALAIGRSAIVKTETGSAFFQGT